MIRSMTGYGRGETRYRGSPVVAEIRSVNHRYLDILVRLPKALSPVEERFKKLVQKSFSRGRVELSVAFEGGDGQGRRQPVLDRAAALRYYRLLRQIQREFKLPGEIDLGLMANFGVITAAEPPEEREKLAVAAERALGQAIRAVEAMRRKEGAGLAEDLLLRLTLTRKALDRIEGREPVILEQHKKRIAARVSELMGGGLQIDPGRLAQEVAIAAERSDITEEVKRLQIHFSEFEKRLLAPGRSTPRSKERPEPIGRTLDFLLQEMNREVNTIGSKANDADVSLEAVGMKAEMEKIREQVQNVE